MLGEVVEESYTQAGRHNWHTTQVGYLLASPSHPVSYRQSRLELMSCFTALLTDFGFADDSYWYGDEVAVGDWLY